ncbi:uncharacterized protein LOC102706218 [Oryza brachyantha]|uniref:uncharacterized protein LOC102706218 n=1 Tax=Oryza brachyantha TaxID=4533 RepID=UPI000776A8FE|nr:uncharacterized protein LOC102706218 [Oryza brachyantha]
MATDSSAGMAMALYQGHAYASFLSLHHHHQQQQMEMEMLSFQSIQLGAGAGPDSHSPAPTFLLPPPNASASASASMLLAPSSSSSALPKYKFVTCSPADWTDHDLAIFNDGLLRYAHEPNIIKYIKIAAMLPTRTIRDVALRCCWTPGNESRRGKPDEVYTGKTIRGSKEKMVSSTLPANFQIPNPNNMVPFSISMHHQGQNSLIHKEVPVLDSASQHLLEETSLLLSQIAENIETFKMMENMELFLRTNNNIRTVLKRMSETPGIMGQMPPLPVPVNEGSLNSLLQMDRMMGAYGKLPYEGRGPELM